jgi:hypothetical protein
VEHYHHAVVLGRLAGENNTGKETWMKNCSALLPSAFFVVLSVRNRVNILFHGVCINYLFFICLCNILNINVQIIYRIVDCDVVMLPFAVSLKAGSITGVPMSPGYGGYLSTTPPPYYTTTTFARTGYYTEAHNYYTTKAPEYYTAADAAPSYIIKRTTPRLQLITPPKRLNTTPSRPSTTPTRLQSITPQLVLPRAATPKPRSITLP